MESIDVVSSEKKVTGSGIFLGQKGSSFSVDYNSENSIGSLEFKFSSKSKVKVNKKELVNLIGKEFKELIPDAISKSIKLNQIKLQFSKTNKKLESVELKLTAFKNWSVFSKGNFELHNIKIDLETSNPTDKKKRKYKGILTGETSVGGKEVTLASELTQKKESLKLSAELGKISFQKGVNDLIGNKVFDGISIPDKLIKLDLNESKITIAPNQKWITLDATSNFGLVDIYVHQGQKKKKSKTGYLITITTPEATNCHLFAIV
ncbi:MAG: hypothetical protein AAGK97_08685 [Bacteroidota bacterium]